MPDPVLPLPVERFLLELVKEPLLTVTGLERSLYPLGRVP